MDGTTVDGDAPATFRVLGPVAMVDAAGLDVPLGPPRHRAVLAALLAHPGVTLSVDRLTELIWPRQAPPTAATMVHGAVAGLRRALTPRAPLVTRDGGYLLDVAADRVDAARFERMLATGRTIAAGEPARGSRMLADALGLWRGPAFAGVDAPFACDAGRHLDELRLQCAEERMAAELALGHHHDVLAAVAQLAAEHPWRERFRAQLMVALYRCGRHADALAAYRAHRRALRAELGLDPGPELQRLERAILVHGDELQARTPPGPARLPVPISTFVGRTRERGEVARLVGQHRLVTLTGPGGSGKTRLAVEVVRAMAGPLDPWLVDLAPLATPALVADAVAGTLGVRPEPGRTLAESLGAALASRDAVVVLDNCEHLLDACAELAQALLTTAGRLRVLATSREPLGVPGEAVYPVRPLPLAQEHDGWERIAACDAVCLFAARASAACRGFAVTDANAALVLDVCRRLDGLPLALELAAARVGGIPLAELAARLDGDRFRLLDSTSRPGPLRHRSLAAAVASGYDLLDGPERTLLPRLAVFPSAFTLGAAECVAGPAEGDIAALLARLVARSLVQLDDGTRYRLLETTRQYGRSLLDDGAIEQLRERHARWCLARAQEAEPHLLRGGSAPWLARVHAEQDDVRVALEWAFGRGGDPELGAALVRRLWHPWDLRGAREEGLHWVRAGLAVIGADRPAERLPLLSAGALFHLGRADFAAVTALAAEQLALAREAGAPGWAGDALAMKATVAWAGGDQERARRDYEAGVAASLAGGDVWRASMAQAQLARLHRDCGDVAAARAAALQALEHAHEIGEDLACGLAVDVLATLEHARGEQATARRLLGEAREHYQRVGYVEGEVSALHLAGRIALAAGDHDLATRSFAGSLHLGRRIGHRAGTAGALEGLATAASARGADEEAVLLLGAAAGLRREIGTPPSAGVAAQLRVERERLDDRLGAVVGEQMLLRGAGLPVDELVARLAGG